MQQIKLIKDVLTPQGATLQSGTSYGLAEWANLGSGCHIYVVDNSVFIPADAIALPTEGEVKGDAEIGKELLGILRGIK